MRGNSVWRRMLCLLSVVVLGGTLQTSADDHAIPDQSALAEHLQQLAGISSGLCSIVGCDDSALPVAMTRSGRFFVHAQDSRPAVVAAARKVADAAGVHGTRVVIETGSMARLPLAAATVDLVLAVNLTANQLSQISSAEIVRALRPGGTAILGSKKRAGNVGPQLTQQQLDTWLKRAGMKPSLVIQDRFGIWARLVRPPRQGVDSWSHWQHGPDNNPVSTDQVIHAPYMTKWLGAPLYITMPAITTSAGGRLFLAMGHIAHHRREEPWLNTVLARNGYNGTVLWKRKLPDGYLVHRSAFIATDKTFYMIDPLASGCLMLDPETGAEKGRISIPELRDQDWMWIAMQDGVLYALTGKREGPAKTTIVRSQYTHWSWGELSRGYYEKRVPWGFGTTILAYDLDKNKLLWTHREQTDIDSRAMVLGPERVFFYGPDSRIGCLEIATGELVWTNDNPRVRKLIEEPGRGLSSTPGFRSEPFSLFTPKALLFAAQTRENVVAVSTEDGHLLWQRRKTTSNPNMIYTDGRLYVGVGPDGDTLAFDPASGRMLADLGFKKRSCARLTATPGSFFCRGWPEGLTRYDRRTGRVSFNGAFRPSCNDGVIPANGLLYLGPWPCDCNLTVMGRIALCSAASFKPSAATAKTGRLETGVGDVRHPKPLPVTARDWPAYRANPSRSASSSVALAGPLARIWQFRPRSACLPTAATTAGGLVLFAGNDGKVRALDAATGSVRWTFLTAGPILQPPTIDDGRAYVGSGDGYVYALEAKTGRLLWRFRVAPADRRIMVYGSLCSTWPVNSGILVKDGVAYAAAGIVDYDGTYVCALDAATGRLKWINDSSGHLDPELRKGVSAQGTLTIANGRLWLAGGNVISPAAYDLQTGRYLSGSPGDGSPRVKRGEEVAVFRDRYVIHGGRLRYTAVRNVVNPGEFVARAIQSGKKLGPELPINHGKIAPAWDGQAVVLVDGRDQPPKYYAADQIERYLRTGNPKKRPSPQWVADAMQGSDTVSIAMAQDAVLVVCETPKFRDWRSNWKLCALNRKDGGVISQQNLPGEALPGGLCVDRDGRVLVVLRDGGVACFGSSKTLAASVRRITRMLDEGTIERADAIRFLRQALNTMQASEASALLTKSLAKLGVHVGDRAARNGCVSHWQLLGCVPWDQGANRVDRVFVGEPNVHVGQPCRIGKRTFRWRGYVTDEPGGKVDLAEIFGSQAGVAAYGYAEVTLPRARDVVLAVGSNDGFKCWFNGQEVGRFDGGRSYGREQDRMHVKAVKGVNKIVMKVTQMGGQWAFSVRLTDPAGKPIDLRPAKR